LNRILTGLLELGLWEQTVIIGFGDHGDEPWSHGVNRGYCHAIAPYSSICWTPMFIFDNGEHQGMSEKLVSLVDLNHTIGSFMTRGVTDIPSEDRKKRDAALEIGEGCDILTQQRSFVFSQNMFALQLEHSDPERGMEKGYAITNGDYRLVVSSGGPEGKRYGMELFCDQIDPTNSRNLLDFFELDEQGEIIAFRCPPDATGMQFRQSFRPAQTDSIIKAFHMLKPQLIRFIRTKEIKALEKLEMRGKKPNEGEYHCFPEKAFLKARMRF
jgi:hypothetical protein